MDSTVPLRAIIIDDEIKGVETLRLLVEKFVTGVKIVATSRRASDAIELIENYKPEIVFLDINMPEMTGFELLEKLSWRSFHLIFVTAHHEYAIQALKNNAVDYLLKPVDHKDLSLAVEKIRTNMANEVINNEAYIKLLKELNQQNKNRILVNLKSGIEHINLNDIVFLESRSNYTRIYLENSPEVLTSKTLKEFDDQLCAPNFHFMRVHKSYVINMKKIIRYVKSTDTIILAGGYEIPLAKSKREEFFQWLNT